MPPDLVPWHPVHRDYIEGRVVDEEGEPVRDAQCSLREAGMVWFELDRDPRFEAEWSKTTNEAGFFSFPLVGRYEHDLVVSKTGFRQSVTIVTGGDRTVQVRLVRGSPAQEEPGCDLLDMGESGTGKPSDPPVQRVRLLRHDGGPVVRRIVEVVVGSSVHRGITDPASGFDVRAAPGAEVSIHAEGNPNVNCVGGCVRFRMLATPSGERVLRLLPPRAVRLTITGPAPEAIRLDTTAIVQGRQGAEYRLLVPNDSFRLFVEASGYVPFGSSDWSPSAASVRIHLPREALIFGRVADSEGNRPAVRVNYREVDNQGRFRISSLRAGTHVVEVQARPGLLEVTAIRREVEVSAGQSVDLGTLVLPPRRTVIGLVTNDRGVPQGGVQLKALARELGAAGHAVTRGDGRFLMPVIADEFRVMAWKRGTGVAITDELDSDARVKLQLEPEPRLVVRGEGVETVQTADGFPLDAVWNHPGEPADRFRPVPAGPLRIRIEFKNGPPFVTEVTTQPGTDTVVEPR